MDKNGNLYETTSNGGGGASCPNGSLGCGTLFKIAPDGTETVLYAFTGGADGASPYAGLISDNAGNLYGTAGNGGNMNCSNSTIGCGTFLSSRSRAARETNTKRTHRYSPITPQRHRPDALLRPRTADFTLELSEGAAGSKPKVCDTS
jgi:hypothetical protein